MSILNGFCSCLEFLLYRMLSGCSIKNVFLLLFFSLLDNDSDFGVYYQTLLDTLVTRSIYLQFSVNKKCSSISSIFLYKLDHQ